MPQLVSLRLACHRYTEPLAGGSNAGMSLTAVHLQPDITAYSTTIVGYAGNFITLESSQCKPITVIIINGQRILIRGRIVGDFHWKN